jgi:hypothetical protein
MGFKSDKQRKCVMAKLNAGRPKALKNMTYPQLIKKGILLPPKGDADKDGVMNKNDCRPLNAKEQGKIHDFFKRLRKNKKFKKLSPSQKRRLSIAEKDLKNATTKEKLNTWIVKHSKALTIIGTIGLPLFGILPFAPVAGTIGAGLFFGGAIPALESTKDISKERQKIIKNKFLIIQDLKNKGFNLKQANKIISAKLLNLRKREDFLKKKQK